MPRTRKTSPGTKILFVASNPTTIKYNFEDELHRIETAGLRRPGAVRVTARWSVSLDRFKEQLGEIRPDVVHVLSPGVDPAGNRLILSDEKGHPQYVGVDDFAGVFARRRATMPKVVVLNTCHSRPHVEALVRHVGCAIGMDGTIYDHTAIAFADAFYNALVFGDTVAKAFSEGRRAAERLSAGQGDIPILLTGKSDPNQIVLNPTATAKRSSRAKSPKLEAAVESAQKPACVQIFCSYSHKDSKYRSELEVFLSNLRQQGLVQVWHDRLIEPGMDWAQEIDRNLNHANLVLLLVSADFMASQYCMGIELRQALKRQKAEGVRVVPILIRECDLVGAPFSSLQWLPTGSKPVKKWKDRDSAWTDVAKGIRQVVEELVLKTR